MRISFKIAILVAGVFAALMVAQLLVGLRVLMPSFAALERDEARLDMDRANDALESELDQLALVARDWGNWMDVYEYMQRPSASFVRANLYPEEFRNLRTDMLILMDRDGEFVWSGAYDSTSLQPLDFAFAHAGALPANHPWREALRSGATRRGLLSTERGPLLAVQVPILNGTGTGPSRGALLIGRLLGANELERIATQAHVSLRLLPPELLARSAQTAPRLIRLGSDSLIEREGTTEVYRTSRDIFGRPIFALCVDVPRLISTHGARTVGYTLACVATAGATVLFVLLVSLRRTVVHPLAQLTRHALAIGDDPALAARLDSKRRDEIGLLTREFDRMLDRWVRARRALADRAFEAGVGEMSRGTLHNIGNAITPLAVRVENVRQRLRQAPFADLDPALRALEQAPVGSARRHDCERFVTLIGEQLVRFAAESSADLESIKRQVDDARRVIADQRRFAQRAESAQPVALVELVRECAEIIPAPLRSGLQLRIDASVDTVGTVMLPRITLQQVLQNLLLNGAEAIREAGRCDSTLEVRALRHERPQDLLLEIFILDDGVGIAEENLNRIFERGFSTKSPSINSGIGLHWCATVLRSLGGTLRASSEGLGRGACLQMSIPCSTEPSTVCTA